MNSIWVLYNEHCIYICNECYGCNDIIWMSYEFYMNVIYEWSVINIYIHMLWMLWMQWYNMNVIWILYECYIWMECYKYIYTYVMNVMDAMI